MVFFHPQFYNQSNDSFVPLFQFLQDFDNHCSQKGGRRAAVPRPRWQPNFDVRETADAFELYGELPGVSKEDVNIKFTDHQTILIHGKTERSSASAAPALSATPAEEPVADTTVDDSDKHSTSSYQATVEDDFEDLQETIQEAPKQVEKPKPEAAKQPEPAPKAKYWVTERSVGEFSRSFQFPSRIEQEATNASFQDGILKIVVPKSKKVEFQRIAIF